jgi:hypothetical protein
MNTSHLRRLLVAATFLLSLSLCRGQLLTSGHVTYPFTDSSTAVYQVGGNYHFEVYLGGSLGNSIPVTFDIPINQSTSGALSGTRYYYPIVYVGDGDALFGSYTANGKISGGSGATRATLAVKLSGRGTISGVPNRSLSVSLKYTISQVTTNGLIGTMTGSISIKGLGSTKLTDPSVQLLPSGRTGLNGTWYMEMDLSAASRIIGTGSITFNQDTSVSLGGKATGAFSKYGDQASIKFTCVKPYTSSAFTLIVPTDSTSPSGIKGKILGQTVREGL